MPLLLRTINQNKWHVRDIQPWLDQGEIPADPLTSLTTTKNALSVYTVEDDRSNLERIITALAANRGKLDKVDYLLFDPEILSTVGIEAMETQGKTRDSEVNRWHLDLVEISGSKLLALVTAILRNGFETERLLPGKVSEQIRQAVDSGHIPRDKLPSKLQEDVFPS